MVIVITGVSGIGKTTIGRELARQLGWTFLDADVDHDEAAIAKMAEGISLTDADRWPWLERVRARVTSHLEQGEHVVLACSALKRAYRDVLRKVPASVVIVQLQAPVHVVADRLLLRSAHFAGVDLLDSQLDTEEPAKNALLVDASADVETVVRTIRRALEL